MFGKIQGKTEWQQILRINHQARWENKIVKLLKTENFVKLSQLGTQSIWLARFREREFWLDALMFALIWFIFGYRIIIWHPLIALIIASGFMTVKHQVGKQNKLATNNLFATVATIAIPKLKVRIQVP